MKISCVVALLMCLTVSGYAIEQQKEEEIDICTLPADPGPCKAKIPAWYFDPISQTCKEFEYGGCKGNDNNFESPFECKKRCPINCTAAKDPGPCKASLPRYYYNEASGSCEQFQYGGCKGNDNNFMDIAECQESCVEK